MVPTDVKDILDHAFFGGLDLDEVLAACRGAALRAGQGHQRQGRRIDVFPLSDGDFAEIARIDGVKRLNFLSQATSIPNGGTTRSPTPTRPRSCGSCSGRRSSVDHARGSRPSLRRHRPRALCPEEVSRCRPRVPARAINAYNLGPHIHLLPDRTGCVTGRGSLVRDPRVRQTVPHGQ